MSVCNRKVASPGFGVPRAPPGLYVVLMETNDEEKTRCYFIRLNGNEDALNHLQKQLKRVDNWDCTKECNSFRLDLDHPVSAGAVAAMLKVRSNGYVSCVKLDGKMRTIDFRFTRGNLRSGYGTMRKVTDVIGDGRIEKFFD